MFIWSTICRELKRNTPTRGRIAGQYTGAHAQGKTDSRHLLKAKQVLLTDKLKERIPGLMKHQKWSTELIAKPLAKEGEPCVSHETIYKWIWMAKHSNHRSALLVMTDRATLVTMIEKLNSKNAQQVCKQMKHRLTRFNPSRIKTITFDNGQEFAYHYKMAQDLNVKTYFTRPYTSQDKGT